MIKPQLSILIPSIPSRLHMAIDRYKSYEAMTLGKNVEIILLVDNKIVTIGEKREALKNLSNGKFHIMADEDDEFVSFDEIYEATFQDVDVITYNASCSNDDGSRYTVTQRLGNQIEHNTKDGKYLDCKRPPFQNCAWHEKFKKYSYPAISYGEDAVFLEKCWAEAKTEVHIQKVLFKYNFNPEITEASTESNEFWKNPNESNR